jgi:LCP family protein required for cell wall assembly
VRTLHRPRRTRLTIALAIVGGIAVVAVLAVAAFALTLSVSYDSKRHVVDAFPATADRPKAATGTAGGAVNLLLIGTDVDAADPESPQFVGKREADTLMLLHIPADRSKVYAVSILRNSLVDVPGHGEQAINAAYAYGGVKLTVAATEHLLNVRVDHVVDVSLTGLRGLTDALGGVDVTTPTAFSNDGIDFPAGTSTLDGREALAYLRAGDYRAKGDSTRAAAQEQYFRAVMRQVLSAKLLLDPAAMAASVSVFSPYLATDSGLDSSTIAGLGLSLRGLHSSDLVTVRVATSGAGTVDGASVLTLDRNRVRVLSEALRTDAMFSYSN